MRVGKRGWLDVGYPVTVRVGLAGRGIRSDNKAMCHPLAVCVVAIQIGNCGGFGSIQVYAHFILHRASALVIVAKVWVKVVNFILAPTKG